MKRQQYKPMLISSKIRAEFCIAFKTPTYSQAEEEYTHFIHKLQTALRWLRLCYISAASLVLVLLFHISKSSPQKPVIPFQYILPIVMGLQTHMSHAHLKPVFLLACTDKTQMLPQCRLSRACSAPALTEDLQKPLQ